MDTLIGSHARILAGLVLGTLLIPGTGCQSTDSSLETFAARDAIEQYRARHAEQHIASTGPSTRTNDAAPLLFALPVAVADSRGPDTPVLTLGILADEPTSQPASGMQSSRLARDEHGNLLPPPGYWREDIWHQMGHEAKELVTDGLWSGFESSFWDAENLALLTATMGASIAIRETGVDDTVRSRTRGHRQLGDFDESIQILGNPGTHFAGAGVLWLTSALTEDFKQHEVAKSMTEALAVNGITTLALKAAANTRTPDGERFGWPSGHTSSAFTVAAVLNEHYGPWVGVPSLAMAGLVGYQRLDSRVHDFSDVVFGGMLGYVIGSSIARDGKAEFPELFGMKVVPYTDPETGAAGLALYGEL